MRSAIWAHAAPSTTLKCRAAARPGADAPLLEALQNHRLQRPVSLHTPGHKHGVGLLPAAKEVLGTAAEIDLTELAGLDNLAAAAGPIQQAQQLAAQAFRADRTWFLVNGSTVGVHAAVMAACAPGGRLLLPRSCHQSAFEAMVQADAEPVWLRPHQDHAFGIAHGVTPEAVTAALRAGGCSAVLVTSPTYFGAGLDVQGIAEACHRHGVPLIVDQAHGSHFSLHPAFPQSAMAAGADIAIQSTHKTLSSLTQSAMLHLRGGRVDAGKLARALALLQSSSPSYLLMASVDAARAQAVTPGAWAEPLAAAAAISAGLAAMLPREHVLSAQLPDPAKGVAAWDPLRITFRTAGLGCTGRALASSLEEAGVWPELATDQVVVLALGAGSRLRDADRLLAAMHVLRAAGLTPSDAGPPKAEPLADGVQACRAAAVAQEPAGARQQCVRPREAFFSPRHRVALEDAAGQVSAELLCTYPPGIPVAFPGERLTPAAVAALRAAAGSVTGAGDASLHTVAVL